MKNIQFVPIDNRPITYSLTGQICAIYKEINLFMPDISYLGGLNTGADTESILNWLKQNNTSDLLILSLDTLAYGGLVLSRRSKETSDCIKSRVMKLADIIKEKKKKNPDCKVYATSSIMRISNNNQNEEEKEWWKDYGKKVFQYSYNLHKARISGKEEPKPDIPEYILDDYFQTRKRNFEINKLYLDLSDDSVFDFLIFSKDDTGQYGLNVEEAQALEDEIGRRNLNAIVKTGADEIPLGLLLRGVAQDIPLKIKTVYSAPNSVDKISRYEDISVQSCVEAQIKIGVPSAKIINGNEAKSSTSDDFDLIFYINNFENTQGDLVFCDIINSCKKNFAGFNSPYFISDINNANGADNSLAEQILSRKGDNNFLGYSGYNTSANSTGSALAIGVLAYLAKKNNRFDEIAFKKLLAVRFLDDWAYQANIRKNIRGSKNFVKALEDNRQEFVHYEKLIKDFVGLDFEAEYFLPWERSFEIGINIGRLHENKI